MGTKFIAVPPPPHLLSLFPLTCIVWPMAAFFPLCMGSHRWLARIWQSREQTPSRNWLLTVEAPGFLRHPTSRSFLVLWMGSLNNCVIGPLNISSLFTLASDTHHYNNRFSQAGTFTIQNSRTQQGGLRQFYVMVLKAWNWQYSS